MTKAAKPYVALLRAVNVGGTGKLSMADLKDICTQSGLGNAKTYIASGNVVFTSDRGEADIRKDLEARLASHTGQSIRVLVRTATEVADVARCNPFRSAPGNQVVALFTDAAISKDPQDGAAGLANERVAPGRREIYVHYPDGMGRSRLRLPAEKAGTARNMNTVIKLAMMAKALKP